MNPADEQPDEASAQENSSGRDQRNQSDRREKPTSIWGAFPPAGNRMGNRRKEERDRQYFVDRFPTIMLVCILLLLIASMTDATLTMVLIQAGGKEVNPLMEYLMAHGLMAFLIGKYLLTVVGIPFLLLFNKFFLFGTKVRVGYLIPCTVAIYAVLIGYQLVLIDTHVSW
jgi:hypothetical protein